MTTATLLIDSEHYVTSGVGRSGMTCRQWAAEFARLGGQQATVTFTKVAPGVLPLHFAGSDEAMAFVSTSVRLVTR